MSKDDLFKKKLDPVPPFVFNDSVASVFSDMIRRSVPGYGEILRRQAQVIARHAKDGCRLYDLGCSNGNLIRELASCEHAGGMCIFAVDNSPAMLNAFPPAAPHDKRASFVYRVCAGIEDIRVVRADVVVVNFTLQFVPPGARMPLLKHIHSGLVPGGLLLLSEKIVHRDEHMAALEQDFHHRFKRENGYSDLEISQKRDALEDVLIPDTMEVHLDRLSTAGFDTVDVWFKWFNFAALICRK